MVTGLEINVRFLHEAVIENTIDPIRRAQWWHCAGLAIAE
jgi:hypothetical protein